MYLFSLAYFIVRDNQLEATSTKQLTSRFVYQINKFIVVDTCVELCQGDEFNEGQQFLWKNEWKPLKEQLKTTSVRFHTDKKDVTAGYSEFRRFMNDNKNIDAGTKQFFEIVGEGLYYIALAIEIYDPCRFRIIPSHIQLNNNGLFFKSFQYLGYDLGPNFFVTSYSSHEELVRTRFNGQGGKQKKKRPTKHRGGKVPDTVTSDIRDSGLGTAGTDALQALIPEGKKMWEGRDEFVIQPTSLSSDDFDWTNTIDDLAIAHKLSELEPIPPVILPEGGAKRARRTSAKKTSAPLKPRKTTTPKSEPIKKQHTNATPTRSNKAGTRPPATKTKTLSTQTVRSKSRASA